MTDDPLFVDVATGDLQLDPNSPYINQGDNAFVSGVETDLDGKPRIIDGVVDLGAFESCTQDVHCDDGDALTTDSCVDGVCVHDVPQSQCIVPVDCDDDNECTTESCVDGVCQSVNNTDACDDGDSCTTSDTCASGVCAGTAVDCDDGNPCTTDTCSNGACQSVANTNICDDGDACTNSDTCASGVCAGVAIDCDDGDDCTDDVCVAGTCVHRDALAGTVCTAIADEGCSEWGTCDGFGGCLSDHLDDETPCDDGLFCNGRERCSEGVCAAAPSVACDAGSQWCDEEADACIDHGGGDFNEDGVLDLDDYYEFLGCFGSVAVPDCNAANMTGSDGAVDLSDFSSFQIAFDDR